MLLAPTLSNVGQGLGSRSHPIPEAPRGRVSSLPGQAGEAEVGRWADGRGVTGFTTWAGQASGALVGVMSNLPHYMDS